MENGIVIRPTSRLNYGQTVSIVKELNGEYIVSPHGEDINYQFVVRKSSIQLCKFLYDYSKSPSVANIM